MFTIARIFVAIIVAYSAYHLIVSPETYGELVSMMFSILYVHFPVAILHIIQHVADLMKAWDTSDYNLLQDCIWLFGFLVINMASLILPVIWLMVITVVLWFMLYSVLPWVAMLPVNFFASYDVYAGMPSLTDLVLKKTTVEKSLDAHIQAKAIRKELERI